MTRFDGRSLMAVDADPPALFRHPIPLPGNPLTGVVRWRHALAGDPRICSIGYAGVGVAVRVGAVVDEIAVGTDQLFVGNFASRSISVIDPG